MRTISDNSAQSASTQPQLHMFLEVGRVLLGLLLITTVLLRVFVSDQIPTEFSPEAQAWLTAMEETGYFTPLLLITEFVIGILLVSGFFVPIALIIFAPVNLNIFLFHAVLYPQPIRLLQIAFMAAVHLALVWKHRANYRKIIFVPLQTNIVSAIRYRRWSIVVIVRTMLGLLFIITGIAKLLGLTGELTGLVAAMQDTGYLYSLLGIVETAVGLMFVAGLSVPLALVMLAPILANILAFHVFLDQFSVMAIVSYFASMGAAYLAWLERHAYSHLFSLKARQ